MSHCNLSIQSEKLCSPSPSQYFTHNRMHTFSSVVFVYACIIMYVRTALRSKAIYVYRGDSALTLAMQWWQNFDHTHTHVVARQAHVYSWTLHTQQCFMPAPRVLSLERTRMEQALGWILTCMHGLHRGQLALALTFWPFSFSECEFKTLGILCNLVRLCCVSC